MDWVILIFEIVLAIAIFFIGLYAKKYLPSYMEEKGKNLATKEDIAEITRKTEEVQKEFKEGFEIFTNDVKFKYDFYYKQYANLYCKLYAIVMQSEYIRYFLELTKDTFKTFEDAPFLEIKMTKETLIINNNEKSGSFVERKIENIETPISQFNKKELCNYIIANGSLASQKLLKLAVSYRYAYDHYSGNETTKCDDVNKIADEEEIRLLRDIVITIVTDYNSLRKELKLEYNKNELDTGIPTLNN